MPNCRLCKQEKQIDQITLTHSEGKEYTCHFCMQYAKHTRPGKEHTITTSDYTLINDIRFATPTLYRNSLLDAEIQDAPDETIIAPSYVNQATTNSRSIRGCDCQFCQRED